MMKLSWRMAPLLIAVVLLTVFLVTLTEVSEEDRSSLAQNPFPALSLNSWDESTPVFANTIEKHPYTFINIFASWCVPCIAEMPLISKLRDEHNLTTLGILWRDDDTHARTWLKKIGDPFTYKFIDRKGSAAIELGMYGVPESYIVNSEGTILWHIAGPLTQQVIDKEILPLITTP